MDETIAAVIAAYPERVADWLAGRPGAWGFLAARAVLAERGRLGRRLSDTERRAVWQALWDRLLALRPAPSDL
jgi:hypothetical protein